MPQFVLIDHSLTGPGSHHYEYALHILRAAEQLGLEAVLACHQSFADSNQLLSKARLFPLFRYSTYGGNTLARPNDRMRGQTQLNVWNRWYCQWRQQRRARRQDRRLQAFRADCHELLQRVRLREGDHVFLPTMSEFDLLALNETLRANPNTRAAHWHLQFHFDFLTGRTSDYRHQQDRLQEMRRRFEQALAGLSEHRLSFYSTTREMADQYNGLGVARFEVLDYPVNAGLRPAARADGPPRPLRAVCAGRFRDEKGSQQLSALVDGLWSELLASGKLQLLVQSPLGPLRRRLRRQVAPCTQQQLVSGQIPVAPVVQVPFPLPAEAYAQLIQRADLGLFLYDSGRYFARCSGVLVEMLASGTPVIVPAGCWLAEEIAEPNQTYLQWLLASLPCIAPPHRLDLTWPTGAEPSGRTVPIPAGARVVSLRSIGRRESESAEYISWEIVQQGSAGARLHQASRLFRSPTDGTVSAFAFPLHPQARQLVLASRNPYGPDRLAVSAIELGFHHLPSDRRIAPPIGAVGLASSSTEQVTQLVREMVQHHEHYRATARAFSHTYRALHHPNSAVRRLLGAGAAGAAGASKPAA